MKSKETDAPASVGTGRGWRRPGYLTLSGFTCWQMSLVWTYFLMVGFMHGHENSCLILRQVTGNPEWPPAALSWSACITRLWSSTLWPSHIRPLCLINPYCSWKAPTYAVLIDNITSVVCYRRNATNKTLKNLYILPESWNGLHSLYKKLDKLDRPQTLKNSLNITNAVCYWCNATNKTLRNLNILHESLKGLQSLSIFFGQKNSLDRPQTLKISLNITNPVCYRWNITNKTLKNLNISHESLNGLHSL